MFTVKEARPGDALKGIARMNPADMDVLGLSEGQIIEIVGKKVTAARVRAGMYSSLIDAVCHLPLHQHLDYSAHIEIRIFYKTV